MAMQVPSVQPTVAFAPSRWEHMLGLCGGAIQPPSQLHEAAELHIQHQMPFLYCLCSGFLLKGLALIRQGGMGHKSQANSCGMMLCFFSFSL